MKIKSILKKSIAIGLSLSLALGLTACGSPNGNNEGDKAKGKEITMMIPDWGAPTEETLKQFKDETGITVKVETVAWDDIRNKVATAANGKKAAADVIEIDWSWVGEFAAADWVEPITVSPEDIKDIPSLSMMTVGDKVLGIPYVNGFRLGFYNTEVYKKAGLKEPKSWDEVAKQMKIIKDKKIQKYPATFPLGAEESATTSLIWLTFQQSGKVFNDDNTLYKEGILRSINYINDLVKNDLVNPGNTSAKGIDTYRQVNSGDAAFMVGPTSFVAKINDPEQSKVVGKVMPILPPGDKGKATQTVGQVEAIGVSKFSKNKEAAETFVKWYTSQKGQEILFDTKTAMPTRTSIISKLIDEKKIQNPGAMLEAAKIVKSPYPNGIPKYYPEMSSAIYNAVNKMALGQLTPEKAFEEMDAKVSELAKNAK